METAADFKLMIKDGAGSSIYSFESIWKDPEPIARKYRAFLTPDSDTYYSSINPIFSFELRDHCLQYFKFLSLRDGVYPLLKFFAVNPVPSEADSYLIIDSQFSSLVPKSWRHKIFLREIFVENDVKADEEECIILISPDRDSQPLEMVIKEVEKLKHFSKLSIYFSSCILKGEEENYIQSNWGYILLNKIQQLLAGKQIEVLDWGQMLNKNVAGCRFHIINPLKFYFSDSFLAHNLLQRGAFPFEKMPLKASALYVERISMNHGIAVYPIKDSEFEVFDDEYNKFFNIHNINVPPAWDDFFLVKLSTGEFKNFASFVANRLQNT